MISTLRHDRGETRIKKARAIAGPGCKVGRSREEHREGAGFWERVETPPPNGLLSGGKRRLLWHRLP
jgi:hypothetical protein